MSNTANKPISGFKKFWKHLSSYFAASSPIKFQSKINGELYVYYINGKLILDTFDSNYSYGGLQKAFRQIFKKIGFDKMEFSNVLLLGFGTGSIVSTILEEYKKNCRITAIEYDPVIIQIGKELFNTGRFKDLSIIEDDAYHYVMNCSEKYDLILFDIYIGNNIPQPFETKYFLIKLSQILDKKGLLVFNKNLGSKDMRLSLEELTENLQNIFPLCNSICLGKNSLFFICKNYSD